jgi:tagatose 6-phosphate kinase
LKQPVWRFACVAANPAIDKTAEVRKIEPGAVHHLPSVTSCAGGKGLNVARVATILGAEPTVLGFAAGLSGRWILSTLKELGIEAQFVWVDGETRTCLSVLDQSTGQMSEFYETGPLVPEAASRSMRRRVSKLLREGHPFVTLSGSLPPGVPTDLYAWICAEGRRLGVRVLLDAAGPPAIAALEQRPWLLKVNAAEAEALTQIACQDGASALVAATRLLSLGACNALVTLGTAGAILATPTEQWILSPPRVAGSYSVGSGDAFLAGLVVALLAGDPLARALKKAGAAGAANALKPGAGRLQRTEVERLERDFRIHRAER